MCHSSCVSTGPQSQLLSQFVLDSESRGAKGRGLSGVSVSNLNLSALKFDASGAYGEKMAGHMFFVFLIKPNWFIAHLLRSYLSSETPKHLDLKHRWFQQPVSFAWQGRAK